MSTPMPTDGYHTPNEAARKRVVSKEELAKHTSIYDSWICIHGLVVDITKFKEDHPGGESILMRNVGTDATEDYDEIDHSDQARKKLADELAIGVLEGHEDTPGIPVELKFEDTPEVGWSTTKVVLGSLFVAAVAIGMMQLMKK
ncbi:hypothetical protein FOL47_001253 [Perkinsus chesapeaki]|uniref:Cytochrome b5 heme-binding domain-containing protein n=2 Tax=Alveolata TaxID=33630 RepID=A0A7J6MJT8_PERCH|nr:hypothetical protein FOL47_001253 [Perkinsus chesapeaki]